MGVRISLCAPCKPSRYVRHRGDDRRAHEGSNPGATEGDKPLPPPGQDPQCPFMIIKPHRVQGIDHIWGRLILFFLKEIKLILF
jgi:hypothetical protein